MRSHISGESSVGNDLRRSVGDKDEPTDAANQGRLLAERRRRRSHRAEDPIRTLMFFASIHHT
ncbi:hypothetical protein Fmac_028014 [Flemingia macrophylla]|uniref:Uncharacterized protein n=1 Tax=Flemingia macrophylla TaxID=520843 RepID=A0ABD1LJC8_9FABA